MNWRNKDRPPPEADARVADVRVMVVKLDGLNWFGMVTLGGVPIRGRMALDPVRAAQLVLWEFTESSANDNARLALTMALEGFTLDGQLAALVERGDLPPDALGVLPESPGSRQAQLADGYRHHAVERGQAGDDRPPLG